MVSRDRTTARVLALAGAVADRPFFMRRAAAETGMPVCSAAAGPLRSWALSEPDPSEERALRVAAVPISVGGVWNSAFPRDLNNGALWSGVGVSGVASGGFRASWRWFSAALHPRVLYEQNRAFDLPPESEATAGFRHPYQSLDWPLRPQAGDHHAFVLGESYLQAANRWIAAGLSTENVWIGPAQVYPILLSATAPGFPHAYLGTVRPLRTPVGRLEVQSLIGRLAESEQFDLNAENDSRAFTALLVDWQPRWVPGLYLGLARVSHYNIPPEGLSLIDELRLLGVINPFFTGGGNLEEGNSLGALYARWSFPKSGFEAYAEWTREDTPYNLTDLLTEPDWTQAYTLGVHQLVRHGDNWFRWFGELVHLGEAATVRAGKGFFSYYTHTVVTQGHTHAGQLLGAAVGPGSDAQILGMELYHGRGTSGLTLERARYDDDTYYRRFARRYGEARHDWEVGGTLRHTLPIRRLVLDGELGYHRRHNRLFLRLDGSDSEVLVEGNWSAAVGLRWRPQATTVLGSF